MAISKGAKVRAEQAVQASIAQADAVVSLADAEGEKARKALLEVLRAADQRLAKKLAGMAKGKGDLRFTQAQALAYRAQINIVIAQVEGKLEDIAEGAGASAIGKSVKQGQNLLAKLEQQFKNVSVSPSVMAAMQQSHVLRGAKASLVTRVATSVDRYGEAMGHEFQKIIQVGLASGASNDEMVAALVKHGGPRGKVSLAAREVAPGVVQRIREGDIPEGLFVRHKYWAERLVRTEVAYAYSGTRYQSLLAMREQGLEVQKKIVAVFDTRTAPDSIAVHGQIRQLEQPFVDGAGRVYQHPPGRPNDRETILPWFDDWEELPSTEPPTEAEQERAKDLANPPAEGVPPPHATPPEDVEHLERLKHAAANAQRVDQAEHDAQRATIELEEERQTRAATLLLAAERDKIKAAQDLVTELEAQKQEAIASAKRKKQEAKLTKWDKAFTKELTGDTPHEAALSLYELAGTDPAAFAEVVNGYSATPLPPEAISGAVTQHHDVLNALAKGALESAGKGLGVEGAAAALDTFKKSPEFHTYVNELATKKDAKSKKKLAALVFSEQEPFLGKNQNALTWKQAQAWAKKPQLTAQRLKDKYPQALKKEWLLESGGAEFTDVFDPDTKKKMGYFKKVGDQYVVDPSFKLAPDKWPKKAFATAVQAADYAAQVGAEIQKLPAVTTTYHGTPKPDTTKTSRFNHKGEPQTHIPPFKIADPKIAKEVAAAKKRAEKHFKQAGKVITRRDNETNNGVDDVLEQEGYTYEQHKWSARYGGECWYSSSEGPKAYVGRFLTPKSSLADAKQIPGSINLHDSSDKAAQKFIDYARVKYAATQAAIEFRIARGELEKHVDAEGYVTLYRGVKRDQAANLRNAREHGEKTVVDLRSVSSWSTSRKAAAKFTDHHKIIVQARVHYTRIFSQYEQEEIAMRRFGDAEAEWIVIADEEEYLLHSEDVTNRDPE